MSLRAISSKVSSVRAFWARMRAFASCSNLSLPSVRLRSISPAANWVATTTQPITSNTVAAATTRPMLNCRFVRPYMITEPTPIATRASASSATLTIGREPTARWSSSTVARLPVYTFSAAGSSDVCIKNDASRKYAWPTTNFCRLFARADSTSALYAASCSVISAIAVRVSLSVVPEVASASAEAARANACRYCARIGAVSIPPERNADAAAASAADRAAYRFCAA